MKKVFRIAGLIVLSLILLLAGCAILQPRPPKPPESVSSIAEAEAYLNSLVEFGIPPGVSLVVVKDGLIVYSQGFGYADGPNQIPATPATIYKWFSMTKIFTAVAILQLHERGQLDIDRPVADYLPFFEVKYPSASSQTVTVRHLLNHSSGMPDNVPEVFGWMHLENEPRPDQTALLQEVFPKYAELRFEPGAESRYSNVGYMVLGAIIEAVSGQTYEDYVVENILQPLGMEHTNFVYTDAMLADAAVGSHPLVNIQSVFLPIFYGNRLGGFIRETTGGRMWFNRFYADSDPPTGLIGPATDLARFTAAYLNGGELDGARILSPETVALMTNEGHVAAVNTGQTDTPVQGLGWEIQPLGESQCLEHGGGGPGFGSAMRLYPDESLAVIVLANDTTYDRDIILDMVASLEW
jgi:CubicO group peptidase (beta-lactamase class C family)